MSFQINGETWQPKTAEEHASAIIEAINTILAENNILDSNGNTAKIKESYGNALYLLALGERRISKLLKSDCCFCSSSKYE